MTTKTLIRSLAMAAALAAAPAMAQTPVKIGLVTTLSGPGGYLGADIRDGFQIAIDMEGGRLGGIPVQLLVEDDGFNPGKGKQVVEKFLKTERIKLVTGIVFSNIAGAAVPDVLDEGAIYVSPNAGPSNFAGKECHKNYFVVSWQNDSLHESAGKAVQDLGYKRAFILAPNYQAGRDALTGFKRFFKGEIAGEVYTRLDQTDYAAEMAQIRAANPDVVFQFHPGGLGITFLRQYQQAGLAGAIPMVVAAPSMDLTTMNSVGDSAVGVRLTSHWFHDFDNPTSKKFVEEFQKKFNRLPTFYASQSFDTALAIGAALKGTNGNVNNTDAFRTAMLKAEFQSVRGPFRFGPNQHPIQDWWAGEIVRGPDGKPMMKSGARVMSTHGDAYAADCKL
jgi:branched-chain amino acid transport system substrate-binding protein